MKKPNSNEHNKFKITQLGPVARRLVSAKRWLKDITAYRFPWYLTLDSANQPSSNLGLACHLAFKVKHMYVSIIVFRGLGYGVFYSCLLQLQTLFPKRFPVTDYVSLEWISDISRSYSGLDGFKWNCGFEMVFSKAE